MLKIGSYYISNNYGPVKVLSKEANDYYVVKFLKTGTIKKFRSSQIKQGCIRDPYAKTVCGVACTGNIKTKGKYRVYYSIWHDMINRCYNPNNKRYKAYENVSVAPEWLVFENFYYDVKTIEGFDDERIRNGELVLDKDKKQRNYTNKIYSKETCTWVTPHENNQMQDSQQKPFVATDPKGVKYKSTNITDFARRHNLRRRNISAVLHGRGKSVCGWKFSYEEIV